MWRIPFRINSISSSLSKMVFTGDEDQFLVSYLGIANNTNEKYAVRVEDDEGTWKIISTVSFAVGIIGSVVSLGAASGVALAAIPLITRASSNLIQIGFVSTAARVAAFGKLLGAVSNSTPTQLAGATVSLASFVHDNLLATDGYVEILPGATLYFGPYRLKPLGIPTPLQATCRRVRVDPDNEGQVVVDTLVMGPIVPGSTAQSNRTHDMKFWIEKNGHKDPYVVSLNGQSTPQRDDGGSRIQVFDELPEGVAEEGETPSDDQSPQEQPVEESPQQQESPQEQPTENSAEQEAPQEQPTENPPEQQEQQPVENPPEQESPQEQPAENPPEQQEQLVENPPESSQEQAAENPPEQEAPQEQPPEESPPQQEIPQEQPAEDLPSQQESVEPAEESPPQQESPQEQPAEESPQQQESPQEQPAEESPQQEESPQEQPTENSAEQEAPQEQTVEQDSPHEQPVEESPQQQDSPQEQPAEESPPQQESPQEQPVENPSEQEVSQEQPSENPPEQESPQEQ